SMDPATHAWVQVLPQRPTGRGKLSEIPFGAKDIVETRGLATEYGSPVYKGRQGTADAAIVAELRRRGAVLMGKTHTTAFAYRLRRRLAIRGTSSIRRAAAERLRGTQPGRARPPRGGAPAQDFVRFP